MWEIKKVTPVLTTQPFTLEKVDLVLKSGEDAVFHRLSAPDWVCILPITFDRKAILIRQARIGSNTPVLEAPGGSVDPKEKDFTMTAARELEEETGFTSKRILSLGSINPNPAILTNKVHMFLALDCQPASPRKHFPDAQEDIDLAVYDAVELETLVRTGQVNHGISALTILLSRNYLSF
jgi:8-oxo-dGTP pyrophosphatase MutT (NUDIX family)